MNKSRTEDGNRLAHQSRRRRGRNRLLLKVCNTKFLQLRFGKAKDAKRKGVYWRPAALTASGGKGALWPLGFGRRGQGIEPHGHLIRPWTGRNANTG